MHNIVSKLLIYGDMPKDSILMELSDIIREYKSGDYKKDEIITRIYNQIKRILEVSTDYAFDKNLWHNYLTYLLITNENPFSLTCEKVGASVGNATRDIISNAGNATKEIITNAGGATKDIISNAGGATKEIITNAGSATKDMISSAGNAAKDKLTAGAASKSKNQNSAMKEKWAIQRAELEAKMDSYIAKINIYNKHSLNSLPKLNKSGKSINIKEYIEMLKNKKDE